jgi:hypothetical protein
VNAEIEHASPWANAPAEKVPGQKKKIGAAAAKAWRETSGGAIQAPAAPLALPAYAEPSFLEKLVALVAVLVRWRSRTKD